MKKPVLSLLPLHTAITAADTELVCMVRMTAPASRATPPTPVNLAIVIDASPSMMSRNPGAPCPLEEVKKAARSLLGRLSDTDRVALVGYSDSASVLHESAPLGGCREALAAAIDRIGVMGSSTNLHAGWLAGANAIAAHAAKGVISRVCLLSDGAANNGISDTETLRLAAQRLNEEGGISTSTYGIGRQFNEALMTAMATAGGGLAFYAEDASAMEGYFGNEFSLLRALVGRRLLAKASARVGTAEAKVEWLNGLSTEGGQRLSDLASGSVSWGLFKVILPKMKKGGAADISVEMAWDTDTGPQASASATRVTVAARRSRKDSEVEERLREVEAAAIQRKAAEDARRGDWQSVNEHLTRMRSMAGNNAYVHSVGETLRACASSRDMAGFSKEATYASNNMSSRQVGVNESSSTLTADPFGLRKAVQGKAADVPSQEPRP